MKCACCGFAGDDPERPIMELQIELGVLVMCRQCWLGFCSIAAAALSGQDNPTREGLN